VLPVPTELEAVSRPDPQKVLGPAGVIDAVGLALIVIGFMTLVIQPDALVTV
jgi:hypothetical protein